MDECEKDARKGNMYGVAVVTREGPFMAGKEIFLKRDFEVVDSAPPDFQLLVRKFNQDTPTPKFREGWKERLNKYSDGLTIFQSDQCPYLAKCIPEISETAVNVYGIKPKIIEIRSCQDAQASPCAFGTFGIVYNRKLLAAHPISNKRFTNIMDKELG